MTANTVSSKNIKVNGLNVHYFTGGQGDPLLIVHGGGDSARAWKKTMAELTADYTIYVPDLPGFGRSQPIEGDHHIPELAQFVGSFSESIGLEKFHLMGHSLGGGIALTYALKSPHRIKKLVLVNSMCMGKEIALWVRFLATPSLSRPVGAAVLGIMRGVRWALGRLSSRIEFVSPVSRTSVSLGSKVTTLKQQTTVLVNRLSEIMMPTLIVWGARDPIIPVSQAYDAAVLIPDCQIKVFEDGGHSVYRQKLSEFVKVLKVFLG